jgi:acyl-CoA dehydrogenase
LTRQHPSERGGGTTDGPVARPTFHNERMEFGRAEEHEAIREGIRRICADFPDEYWAEVDEAHEFPWAFYDVLAAGGWVGIAIPAEYGGGGQGITEASIMLEEIAASGAAMNGCSAIHLSIFGMEPVRRHGPPELVANVLPRVAAGDLHVAFGVTEPDAGTDTAAITTRAVRDGDEYVVTGAKVWTTKAPLCEMCLLLVRTTPREECERPTDGLTLLLVDLQRPEVDITPIAKLGRNAVVSCEVRYDELRVPVGRRVGEEGEGFRYLLDGLNPERILLGGEAIGIGRAALGRATAYARDRVVFGRPIGQNQGIAFPLADAHMRLHAAELAVREASWRFDAGLDCGAAANTAKYLAADAAFNACDRALQTHGGMGYAREYHVERYWREARLMQIAPVSQEMVCNYVSTKVLGLPKSY